MDNATLLRTEDLTVGYQLPVVRDVNFTLQAGSITGVVGPNGTGKSTLLKALAGVAPSLGGSFSHEGVLGYMPQHAELDWTFPATVGDIALHGRIPRLPWWRWPGKQDRDIALAALKRTGMDTLHNQDIGKLSGGQRQRVLLARTLALEPDVLLLDEPFAGVDAASQAAIETVLRELCAEGRGIMVVHHTLSEVRKLCDHALLISPGGTCAAGPIEQVLSEEAIAQAYGYAS
ncbi:metal ABC transporter ATP-binding protein [Corynebacterium lizhenjunii]|uniref:metal ABC transporter ATP-binding protein n=1 Tax=Corynebacterium lizhenjunii TaxID=2709394 RepID=UPI001FD534B2|nr:metal ABC transporter ATP-binding protein [Corynebacterium lizhenjunii]